ncbi:DUF3617 family protein [Sphingomonas sp. 1P06PA]|uniref:DUF3617 domain-containing protein n=1 Tax=Sphingomonas sp. 1P06PA TaxID=554121 RepID=UPI0039A42134
MRAIILLPIIAMATPLAAADEAGLRPGLWVESTAITGATLAGAPATTPLPAPVTRQVCIAPVLAADPGRWFAEGNGNDACTVSRTRVGSGRVELSGSCGAQGIADAARMQSVGRYDGDDYALDVATTMGDPDHAVIVRSRVVASRIGECATAG